MHNCTGWDSGMELTEDSDDISYLQCYFLEPAYIDSKT